MPMMLDRRILVGGMTLQAHTVARKAKLGAVRVMTVAAGNTCRKHLALLERAVIVNLIQHLPVGLIKPVRERRDQVRIGKPSAGGPFLRQFRAARVAEAAGLHLLAQQGGSEAAPRIASLSGAAPNDILALVEAHSQPLPPIGAFA